MVNTQLHRSHPSGIAAPGMTFFLLLTLLATSCASSPDKPGVFKRTLQSIGIQDAESAADRTVSIRIHGGDNLNAGTGSRANAVVVQVYQLRSAQRFDQTRFDSFLDESLVAQALGDDLIASNEIILAPGGRENHVETLSPDAAAIGVVALFQAPAGNRWKLAFDAGDEEALQEGITIGVHACALTTGSAALLTRLPSDAASLVSVRCRP